MLFLSSKFYHAFSRSIAGAISMAALTVLGGPVITANLIGNAAVSAKIVTATADPAARATPAGEYSPVGLSPTQINRQAQSLLQKLTLPEKVALLSGYRPAKATHSVLRLGIPHIRRPPALHQPGIGVWSAGKPDISESMPAPNM